MANHKKLQRTYSIATRGAEDVKIYADKENDFPETVEDVEEIVSAGKQGVDFDYGNACYESIFTFNGDEGDSAVFDKDAGDFLPHRKSYTPYAVVVSHKGTIENDIAVYFDFTSAVYHARKIISGWGLDPDHYPYNPDKAFNFFKDDTYNTESLEVAIKDAKMFP